MCKARAPQQVHTWFSEDLNPALEGHKEQRTTNQRAQQFFERYFSLPILLVLLLANIGVLVGQAVNLTGGQWASAFSLSLLEDLVTSGRFATFWIMREIVIALILLLAVSMLLFKQRPSIVNMVLYWANLVLGLALFIAIAMSSHASAVSNTIIVYAVVVDWLHLLAAALWVGGMIYIAVSYLPVLSRIPMAERARSLITVLPYYSPLAVTGVLIMAVTGPFGATFHLNAWNQLLTTAYGRALVVKILLIGGLLLTSAIHVGLLRPRLRKEYLKYAYAVKRLQAAQPQVEPNHTTKLIAQQVKLREGRLTQGTKRLTNILRWEPVLGVAVLLCVSLMNVFAGTIVTPSLHCTMLCPQ